MAGQTPDPPRASRQPDTGEPTGQQPAPREHDGQPARADHGESDRIGPVAIARHVKADGRALILYTRDTPPSA
jgi:hypothetical protein